MSFVIKDEDILFKYTEIWSVVKKKLPVKLHSKIAYDDKYLKAKTKEFEGNVSTRFSNGKVPDEDGYYACIVCVTIDSIMKIDKKNFPQVYLEECKYKRKYKYKSLMVITQEIETNYDFNSDDEVDDKLTAKLEEKSDNDSE